MSHIYAALSSAKIMLAIGTKHDYYDAVWVKNEWSRFISMMSEDYGKVLIPCFKNMDAYDMPKEFKNMQALDMGDVTFFASLTESIERIIDKSRGKVSKETIVLNNDIGDVAPLLERGFIFLEDKDWKKGDTFFETVLNKDPKNGNAYLGKLLVDLNVSRFEELSEFFTSFSDNYNYEKIMRFGDSELKESVKNCNDIIVRRIEEARKKDIYENALEIMESATTEEMFENAGYMFIGVKDYEDAKQKSEECFEKAEVARIKAEEAEKDAIYKSACAVFDDKHYWHGKETDIGAFEESMEAFIRLNGWRDSKEKIVLCQQRIAEIKKKIEAERIENERKTEEERKKVEKKSKRKKLIGTAVGSFAAVILGFIIVLDAVIIPNGKYNNAVALLDEGNIVEAYETFIALGSHKDSTEKALSIYDNYKVEKLKASEVGNVVKFGYCEQDSDFSNGKEEIEWIVLEKQNNRVLVISKYALNFEPYNAEYIDVTWETCTLRYWLNNDFFNSAFTDTEKAFVSTVNVGADANPEYNTDPGNDTQDKVFLLSLPEVNAYFGSDSERECEPTKHLKSINTDIDSPNGFYFWWWLRSPGSGQNLAVCVDPDGSVYESGRGVDFSVCAVRPAMWITIE